MTDDADPPSSTLKPLVGFLRGHFALEWDGIHGAAHWARVRFHGLRLAGRNGARADVVELFAFLHDAERRHDGVDRDHGKRGARLARRLNGEHFQLDALGLDLLCHAIESHSEGHVEGDLTVRTCWDADRLDLSRLGIRPDPRRLATDEARQADVIEEAWRRARGHMERWSR